MEHYKIENVSFSYGTKDKKVVNNIDLKINKGEFITVCGKSGSGKTTLLKMLKPVLTPFGKKQGEILFNNQNINDLNLKDQVSKIGFVMQDPNSQIVTDKVWHELAFGLENLGIDQKIMRLRVAEISSYFGINSWFHKNVNELSGGQKQLLNLASVMAMQPEVLILDEPTSQLDPIASADFLNTVKKINTDLGVTVIITEHRLENIFSLSDRVIVMENGEIIADDNPRKIGEVLKENNNDMFKSLPSTVKIYYSLNKGGECPLTVREGRRWLDELFENNNLIHTSVKERNVDLNEKPILQLKNIYFRYEKDSPDVLKYFNLEVYKSSMLAVMGGNGSGKSTMLKIMSGLNKPYSGNVYLNGKNMKKLKNSEIYNNNITMLPQDVVSLFLHKTILEDLHDISKDENELEKVIDLCEIKEFLNSHPFDLSGGEIQRAGLAKVLLTKPKILLLDEPTKGIDNFYKEKLADILRSLLKDSVTIVMVSHDVEFCAKYADEVSMLFDGDIVTRNNPNKFFSSNNFYTTSANKMSRHLFENAVTNKEVTSLCQKNLL